MILVGNHNKLISKRLLLPHGVGINGIRKGINQRWHLQQLERLDMGFHSLIFIWMRNILWPVQSALTQIIIFMKCVVF